MSRNGEVCVIKPVAYQSINFSALDNLLLLCRVFSYVLPKFSSPHLLLYTWAYLYSDSILYFCHKPSYSFPRCLVPYKLMFLTALLWPSLMNQPTPSELATWNLLHRPCSIRPCTQPLTRGHRFSYYILEWWPRYRWCRWPPTPG